jgi:spore cortex biosynthesis protein YabQ
VLAGVAVGFLFDFYRSLRKWLGWGKFATYSGDILFSLAALVLFFRFFLRANALDFRFYIIWGSMLGLFIYSRLLSRASIWFLFKVFRLIENIIWLIQEGLKIPVKGIVLLMRPPYAILRWFSLLIFRIAEVFITEPIGRVKKKVANLWDRLFPPRTNG